MQTDLLIRWKHASQPNSNPTLGIMELFEFEIDSDYIAMCHGLLNVFLFQQLYKKGATSQAGYFLMIHDACFLTGLLAELDSCYRIESILLTAMLQALIIDYVRSISYSLLFTISIIISIINDL